MNDKLKIVIPLEIDKRKSDDNIKAYLKSMQNNIELRLTIEDSSQQQSRLIRQANNVIDNIAGNLKPIKLQFDFDQFNLSLDLSNNNLKAFKDSFEDLKKLFKDSANKPDFGIFKDLFSQELFDNIKNPVKNMKDLIADLKNLQLTEINPPLKDAQTIIDIYNENIGEVNLAQKIFDNIPEASDEGFCKYLKSLNGSKASFDGYNESIGNTSQALAALTLKTLGFEAVQMAANAAIGMGVGLLINFAVSGITKLIQAHQEAIEKSNELTSKFKDSQSEIRNNISALSDLESEYNQLSSGVDERGKNIGLSAEEYKRYKEIVQQIIDISPEVSKGIDSEGNAIINKNTVLREAINLQNQLNDLEIANYLARGETIFNGTKEELSDVNSEINKIKDSILSILTDSGEKGTIIGNIIGKDFDYTDPVSFMKNNQDAIIKNLDLIMKMSKDRSALSNEEINKLKEQSSLLQVQNNQVSNVISKRVKFLQTFSTSNTEIDWFPKIKFDFLDEFYDTVEKIAADDSLESMADMMSITKQLGNSFTGIQDKIPLDAINTLRINLDKGYISADQYNKELNEHINTINHLAQEAENQGLISLSGLLKLIADNFNDLSRIKDVSENLAILRNDTKELLNDVTDGFKNVSKNLAPVSSALKSLVNNERVSIDTIMELIDKYPKYRAELLKINDNKAYGITLVKGLAEAENDANIAAKEHDRQELERKLALLNASEKIIKFEQLRKSLAEGTGHDIFKWMDKKVDVFPGKSRTFMEMAADYQEDQKKQIQNEIDFISDLIDYIKNESNNTISNSLKPDKDKTDKWKEEFEKFYADLQYRRDKDLINSQQYYDELNQKNEEYFSKSDKYKEDYRKNELELYQEQRKISSKKIADIEHEISMLDYQNEEIVTIKELVTQYKALKESKEGLPSQHAENDKNVALYEKEAELLEKINEAAKKNNVSIEEYIDRIDKTNPYEKQISLYKQAHDELLKQIEYTKSLGLLDNNDYLQGLEKQLVEYQKKIVDLEKKNSDDIKKIKEQALEDFKKIREEYLQDEIDSLNNRKTLYESVVNAVTDTIDKEVKSIEDSKDAFVNATDDKIDKLNEEKDSLSKLQKEYETAFSVVKDTVNKQIEKLKEQRDEEEKSWNDKINALKEQNDEIEKQIELEKAQEALEKARNQKNTLIYREGIGFEYEANFDEVNKSKESLDNLNRKLKLEEETKALEELRDNALEIIDSQIKGWEEYGQKWSDVVDSYRRDQDLLIAQQILGKNWESDILHQRTDRLGEFANEYADISYKLETEIEKQIADLEREKEDQIEVYDAKIEKLNEYKDKWTEIVDNYTLEQDRLKAAQILGAYWEREVLDSRLSTFKTFRDEYIGILEELARKQEALNNLQNTKVDESGQIQNPQGGSNKLSDDYWKSYNAKATLPDGTIIGVNIDGSGKTTTTGLPPGTIIHTGGGDFKITGGTGGKYDGIPAGSEKYIDKAKEILKDTAGKIKDTVGKIFGFADGTTFAPGGLSVVDELGQEMIVRNPFQGRYTYLENGDGVIPHNITEVLMKLGSNPIDYLKQSIGDVRIPKTINNQPIQEIIDIGDIKVYGVQNVDGLANAIITELPNMMLQKLYRK